MSANFRETVIDGYNLIHKLMKKAGDKPVADYRDHLDVALARYRVKTRRHVTIVYDGGDGPKPRTSRGAIETVFSGTFKSADRWIIDHVSALGSRAGMILVVTSDREIRRNVVAFGARCVDTDIFIGELEATGILMREPEKRTTLELTGNRHKTDNAPVSDREVEYWLRLFERKK
jgi:predicted RNA-binding protein with PIN domain